jgi:RNA polymerase sporulation-specific sigma factor
MLLMSGALCMLRLGSGTGSFPKPLSAEEEKLYVERAIEGDLQARNTLIEHNLRLVAHIIKKYYTQTDDQDDLISIGTIGLIKGVSTYRPDKGVRLATYASRCIENEILMYFRGQKKNAGVVSLSDSIEADGDGGQLSLMDVIAEDADLLEGISDEETTQRLGNYIRTELDAREAQIISLRYGIDGGGIHTQREVAQICGISRSYVSRIEKKALEKLHECFLRDENA